MNKGRKDKKINSNNRTYNFLRNYVDSSFLLAYRSIRYVGRENIPSEGAVIFAPNHTNALMDALVVLAIDKKAKVFVARADIFKNPTLAKILRFLKIMPIMRVRDGLENVRKNDKIINESVEVLCDGTPFCILPEGTHNARHSLLPLSKGIFRIAMQAQSHIQDETAVNIIPIGIEYGNFFRFRSTALVNIGKPINIKEYLKQHSELSDSEQMNHLKDKLAEEMKDLILYLPNDDNYDAALEIVSLRLNQQVSELPKNKEDKKRRELETRLKANRISASKIQTLIEQRPEEAKQLLAQAKQIYDLRKKKGINLSSVVAKRPIGAILLKTFLFLLGLPYILASSILILPITALSRYLHKLTKDEAFYNSIRFVLTLILWPILLLVYTICIFNVLPLEWALVAECALIPSILVASDGFRLMRCLLSDLKLLCSSDLRKRIKELKIKIKEIL